MTLTWLQEYDTIGTYCETKGLLAGPAISFRKFLMETVRPEWQRWLTLDPTIIQSLTTQVSHPRSLTKSCRVELRTLLTYRFRVILEKCSGRLS